MKKQLFIATAALAACNEIAPAPEAPPPPAASRVASQSSGLGAHSNASNRGVNSFAGASVQARNNSYRTWFVVGSETPVGTGQSANNRVLVGPVAPPAPPITGGVTAFPQPERADYTFTSAGTASWTIELRRRNGASCTDVVARRTAGAVSSVNGLWIGLSPGATYCWSATASDYRGPRTRTGEFTLRAFPTFTAGPAAASTPQPNPFDIEVTASTSTRATGAVIYAAGDCAQAPTTLTFDGSDLATFPGQIVPRPQHTLELWLRVSGASQTRNIATALGGNLRLSLENGNLRYEIRTAPPAGTGESTGLTSVITAQAVGLDRWLHVAATYGAGNMRLYVDGVNLGARAWGGSLVDGLDLSLGGGANGGFVGEIGSIAVYDRPLTVAEINAHRDAGASVELPGESGRVAAWQLAEAPGVQSLYDATGTHHAGVLGVMHTAETSDPGRGPTLATSAAMGTNTQSLTARLTGLTGGPTYCYRVTAQTSLGVLASNTPRTFTRIIDSAPPVVTVNQINVVDECTSSAGRAITLAPPAVTDNFDMTPAIVARRDSRTGAVITFPFTFPIGSTIVHWSATDDSGNVGWADPAQTVRVRDTTIPAVTGGPAQVVEATSPNGTAYMPRPQSATDVCDPNPAVTFTPAGPFPLGDTTVTFTVTDLTGNPAMASRVVRVVDTTGPTFSPPLDPVNVGHPGTTCFDFTPPVPSAIDNAYPASQITVTGTHVSGPGAPACYNLGTHVVEWRAVDPAGNVRLGQQTFVLRSSTINVTSRGLEVMGVANPVPLRWYNRSVTMVFEISAGTPPYQVVVTPRPSSLNNTGNVYRARYDEPGAYPQVLITTRDGNGMGSNIGSTYLEGFGIDTTAPVIEADLLPQVGVNINDRETFPFLFRGESANLERIRARDGADELTTIGRALFFDGNDRVTVPGSASLNTTQALTLEGWVRAEAFSDAALIAKPRADGDGTGFSLGLTAQGRATFELRIGAISVAIAGGQLTARRWHHLAGTYDGRTVRLWVDGVPAAHRIATGAISLGAQPVTLGLEVIGGAARRALSGQLADVAVWRSALDEAAINAHVVGGTGRRITPTAQTVALWRFDGAGQVVTDATANANHGLLGATSAGEADDPQRVALTFPADATSSGLVDVTASLVDTVSGRRSPLVQTSSTPVGAPLAVGARAIGGRRCNAPLGSVCNAGEAALDAELIALWAAGMNGSYRLEVVATDGAGNTTTARIGLRTTDFVGALQNALGRVEALAMLPSSIVAQNELADARLGLQAAISYATMARRYMDGSYLRADNAVEAMLDARVLGVDATPAPDDISRALAADVIVYVRSLGGISHPQDRVLVETANRFLLDARFTRHEGAPGQMVALGRSANDTVAPLYAPYQTVRGDLRRAQARWAELLGFLAAGSLPLDVVREDLQRRFAVEALITSTRNLLRDVVYPEVQAILQNPYTTQPQSLREILDVLDKSSGAMDERGDLIAISDVRVVDACLDRLAGLNLDDLGFTQCYVRLNDLAQFLDRVSEPLVHTYRIRAGVGLALFNMLELSLYIGPQGLPWITSNVPSTMGVALVLPDDEAARISGAVRLTTVDLPDQTLGRAYARYREARTRMEAGDVDAAWAIFVAERCLLVGTYNRYYSTNRTIPNVADPKEPPLNPADMGCSGM